MARRQTPAAPLTFHPLTSDRWRDLEALFGPRGACGGCWCMWWRLPLAEFNNGKGERNRRALERIVDSGECPGILAYADGAPVGWCAIAPRPEYPRLARSRVLGPIDDEPVWSVTCFFVAKAWRRRGLSEALLREAVRFAGTRGAGTVEGYPTDPAAGDSPDPFVYTGLLSTFLRAGFVEAARRSAKRPIMRIETRGGRPIEARSGRRTSVSRGRRVARRGSARIEARSGRGRRA